MKIIRRIIRWWRTRKLRRHWKNNLWRKKYDEAKKYDGSLTYEDKKEIWDEIATDKEHLKMLYRRDAFHMKVGHQEFIQKKGRK